MFGAFAEEKTSTTQKARSFYLRMSQLMFWFVSPWDLEFSALEREKSHFMEANG